MKQLYILILFLLIGSQVSGQERITRNGVEGEAFNLQTQYSNLYYEKFGSGPPLLVLHGNGGSTKSIYRLLPELIADFEVIAVDSPCHGQSSCDEERLSYTFIADEMTSLIQELGYNNTHIWGHSDGGIVALILGYTVPDKIDRMLVSGANTRLDTTALLPEIVEMIKRYDDIPMPEMKLQVKLMAQQQPIPNAKIRDIPVPVTLMVGDRDAVRIGHTLEIFELLPNANLCVLPGTSHFLENPEYVLTQLRQLKRPFRSPSTLEVVQQISSQIFQD